MRTTRKDHPPDLKAKVAVEVSKGHKTATQIVQTFGGGSDSTGAVTTRYAYIALGATTSNGADSANSSRSVIGRRAF